MESKTPTAPSETINDDPPNETNGSGTPVIGSSPVTAPRFTSAWMASQAVMPPARRRPNASGALRAMRIPA